MATKADLEKRVVELEGQVRGLLAHIADLHARLGLDSTNSSKPPSSDGPSAKPRGKRKSKGGKLGGRPGHEGHAFEKFAPDEIAAVVPLVPTHCGHCGKALPELPPNPRAIPAVFQHIELPVLKLVVTEYRRFKRACPCCGKRTRAPLPAGVGPSRLGPRLHATIAVLTQKYRLGRRLVIDLLDDLAGRRFSTATIQTVCERASEAVSGPVEVLKAAIETSPFANLDETGWKHQGEEATGKRWWARVATTPFGTVFAITADRGAAGMPEVLSAAYTGIVVCDRWRPYESVYGARRQLCWAHLQREWKGLVDRGLALVEAEDAPAELVERGRQLAEFGESAVKLTDKLFAHWQAFKQGRISRHELHRKMVTVKAKFHAHLRRGRLLPDPKMGGTCKDVLRQFRVLWTYLDVEGVEPTNNAAERALRPLVILRGISLGTRTIPGQRLVARLASVVATCRQQRRNPIAYLAEVILQKRVGGTLPSLLPA